jgi:hypothetical protein
LLAPLLLQHTIVTQRPTLLARLERNTETQRIYLGNCLPHERYV